MATPAVFLDWPKSLAVTYGPYRAVLDRWSDADTGIFLVDLGFKRPTYLEIRVKGYSSPESGTPEGDAATAFANELAPPGSRARLHSTTKLGTYSQTLTRFAARIELEHGLDYGEALHAAGHARVGSFMG